MVGTLGAHSQPSMPNVGLPLFRSRPTAPERPARPKLLLHRAETSSASVSRLEQPPSLRCAPGQPGKHWMLYAAGVMREPGGADGLQCYLCKSCRDHFRHADKRGLLDPCMPPEARANAMWGGPCPPELEALSFAEAKVPVG